MEDWSCCGGCANTSPSGHNPHPRSHSANRIPITSQKSDRAWTNSQNFLHWAAQEQKPPSQRCCPWQTDSQGCYSCDENEISLADLELTCEDISPDLVAWHYLSPFLEKWTNSFRHESLVSLIHVGIHAGSAVQEMIQCIRVEFLKQWLRDSSPWHFHWWIWHKETYWIYEDCWFPKAERNLFLLWVKLGDLEEQQLHKISCKRSFCSKLGAHPLATSEGEKGRDELASHGVMRNLWCNV